MADSEWTAGEGDRGVRLDKFLAGETRLGSRAKAFAAIERGKVYLNGEEAEVAAAATKLSPGDVVRVWMDRPGSSRPRPRAGIAGDLDIVYEDDALIVVNKPAGLLAVPLERRADAVSVLDQIETHFRSRGKRKALVVHRIDRDTSGLVVFAKHLAAQLTLKAQFKNREPERVYLAVVYGHPEPPSGTWQDYLVWDIKALIQKETSPRDPNGREAISHYRVVEHFDSTSLVEVQLETGKRNQIRIQARLRGHTLVGEQRYIYGPESLRDIPFNRQALHAQRLGFVHPSTHQPMRFEAPLPPDMADLLARLRA